MRASLSLAFIALFSSVVYGFSSPTRVVSTDHCSSSGRAASCTTRPSVLSGPPPAALGTNTAFPMAGTARGGALQASGTSVGDGGELPKGPVALVASFWGTFGVLYILGKAIKRVAPIAMEPFAEGGVPLSQFQLGCDSDDDNCKELRLVGYLQHVGSHMLFLSLIPMVTVLTF